MFKQMKERRALGGSLLGGRVRWGGEMSQKASQKTGHLTRALYHYQVFARWKGHCRHMSRDVILAVVKDDTHSAHLGG